MSIKDARDAAWRAAMAMAQNNRSRASEVEAKAQLVVIRRILGAMLAGGEAEFWAQVEVELRK